MSNEVDIVIQVINAVLAVKPDDTFCKSIALQYMQRGGLSKKQLEGLHSKACKINNISSSKLATLEAIIKKKHITHKSEVTIKSAEIKIDTEAEKMITEILEKYPQHKRVLLFKANFLKDKTLNTVEKAELEKFYKLLIK